MTNLNEIISEPLYPIAHAAHYVNVHPQTLMTWMKGRHYNTQSGDQYWKPLIQFEKDADGLLSFNNLVEAHVLRAMRKVHSLKMPCIRKSLDYVSKKIGKSRPLATEDFQTDGATLFIHHLGELIDLSQAEQIQWENLMKQHLVRIERNTEGLAEKLYPMTRPDSDKKIIVINPKVSHGRPIIESRGVTTDIIVDRWKAGDTFELLHKDYGLSNEEYDEAIWYEQHEAA